MIRAITVQYTLGQCSWTVDMAADVTAAGRGGDGGGGTGAGSPLSPVPPLSPVASSLFDMGLHSTVCYLYKHRVVATPNSPALPSSSTQHPYAPASVVMNQEPCMYVCMYAWIYDVCIYMHGLSTNGHQIL